MPYATSLDLVIAFGANELAQAATPKRFDIVEDERLESAIEDPLFPADKPDELALEACLDAIKDALEIADSIVDSYITVRYTLPLAVVPLSLKKRTLDLARFELNDEKATEEVRNRRNDAIKWLESIAAGKVKIGDVAIDSGAGSNAGIAQTDGSQLFTQDSLVNYGLL